MWRHQLKDWEKVSLPAYKFCFEQSQKRLDYLFSQSDRVTNRAYNLLNYVIALLSVLIGLLYKTITSIESVNAFTLLALVNCVALIWCMYSLYQVIKPRRIKPNGAEPKRMLLSEYLEQENLTDEETVMYLHFSEMEIIQDKIDFNSEGNTQRINLLGKCIQALIVLSILSLSTIVYMAITVVS